MRLLIANAVLWLAAILGVAFWFILGYIAIHFLMKYW